MEQLSLLSAFYITLFKDDTNFYLVDIDTPTNKFIWSKDYKKQGYAFDTKQQAHNIIQFLLHNRPNVTITEI